MTNWCFNLKHGNYIYKIGTSTIVAYGLSNLFYFIIQFCIPGLNLFLTNNFLFFFKEQLY